MSFKLENLQNTTRPYKRRIIVGRGPGSRKGKTSARGQKGAGARAGYKTRQGFEGGGVPLFKRSPTRGFTRGRFQRKLDVINLGQIEKLFQEGETVSLEALRQKKYIKGCSHGVKVLGVGELTKKVKFQVEALSESAKEKLNKAGISI
jgi:large subunit ribosomal protein L15